MPQVSQYFAAAVAVVRDAGRMATAAFRHAKLIEVKDGGDPVTQADISVERQVIASLSQQFPDHGFISEESGERDSDSEFVWILDPIDGTNYFTRGIPMYAISLALRRAGQLVLGVVYVVETDQLFTAAVGAGARLDNQLIHCSAETELANSTIVVEIPNRHAPPDVKRDALAKVGLLMDVCQRQRMIGVSTLGMCYCAMGGFDAYVNLSHWSKIWDVAAGHVILQEAGAVLTTTSAGEMIGAPPQLHDEIIDLLGL